jgi:hypothetical protein
MKKLASLAVLCVIVLGLLGGCGQPAKPVANAPGSKPASKEEKIAAALAKLAPEDKKLAEAQKFCALENESPLGGMGEPYKLTIEGQTVFLCCKGCENGALENPEETLAKVEKLKEANK